MGALTWTDLRAERGHPIAWLGRHRTAAPTVIPDHRLPGWQVAAVESGRLVCQIDGADTEIAGGQAVIMAPGTRLDGPRAETRGLVWWIGLAPERPGSLPPDLVADFRDRLEGLRGRRLVASPDLFAAAADFHRLLAKPPSSPVDRALAVWRRAVPLAAACLDLRTEAPRDEGVAAALEAMAGDPARDWAVPELAARCGLGPSRFHDRFRAAIGTTPHDHLARLRIEAAREMAADPAMTLEALARAVGFSTPQSLARAIRRRTGTAAMAWLRPGPARR